MLAPPGCRSDRASGTSRPSFGAAGNSPWPKWAFAILQTDIDLEKPWKDFEKPWFPWPHLCQFTGQ